MRYLLFCIPHGIWCLFTSDNYAVLQSQSYNIYHRIQEIGNICFYNPSKFCSWYSLDFFLNSEDEGSTFLRNISKFVSEFMVWHRRRSYTSQPPLWEPQSSHSLYHVTEIMLKKDFTDSFRKSTYNICKYYTI
jgi:hypothetical protein